MYTRSRLRRENGKGVNRRKGRKVQYMTPKARREVELRCATFEPEWRKLDEAIDAEEEAWGKMRDFINTPRN
jgi:hypothetical protein